VHEQFPKLRESQRFTELSLSKLSSKASSELVQAVLGELPPERLERLVERAGGNPFFLEELVRAAGGGVDQLPETVLGMLEARIAGLAPEARLVLRAASVFGDVFWKDGVARLLDQEVLAKDLSGWLLTLRAQELLVPHGASRFAGHEHGGRRARGRGQIPALHRRAAVPPQLVQLVVAAAVGDLVRVVAAAVVSRRLADGVGVPA
jgi:hypothetical protein